MRRSFVKFRDAKFACHDVDVIVWADYAHRAIAALPSTRTGSWQCADRLGAPYSFMSILDQWLTDLGRAEVFLNVNRNVIRAMEIEGRTISVERLKQIETQQVFGLRLMRRDFIVDFALGLERVIKLGFETIS